MIDIEHLQVTIGSTDILKDVGLHLAPGDIYGLLGPNGAGKSTTILALLGLRRRSGGRVSVLGQDPARDASEIRRFIGVMPENGGFYEWMTASVYLQWHARLYGVYCAQGDLEALLGKVGLAAAAHHPIETFSRGMKQRLALARALLPRPRLLILDEPTNGLDPKGRREIHDLLAEFAAGRDTAVLLCTHLLDDVDRLCNRIGVLDHGRTRIEGAVNVLLTEQWGGRRFRLRLENGPESPELSGPGAARLPAGVTVLDHEGAWWRVQVMADASGGVSSVWRELWQRGWKISEIQAESSSLETLYLGATGQEPLGAKEASS